MAIMETSNTSHGDTIAHCSSQIFILQDSLRRDSRRALLEGPLYSNAMLFPVVSIAPQRTCESRILLVALKSIDERSGKHGKLVARALASVRNSGSTSVVPSHWRSIPSEKCQMHQTVYRQCTMDRCRAESHVATTTTTTAFRRPNQLYDAHYWNKNEK